MFNGVEYSGGGSSYVYSTTEQEVGVWIDGSKIYKVTIPGVQLSAQNTSVDLSAYNPKIIFFYEGYCESSDGSVNRLFPYYNNGSYYANVYYDKENRTLHIVSEGYSDYPNVVFTIIYNKQTS